MLCLKRADRIQYNNNVLPDRPFRFAKFLLT